MLHRLKRYVKNENSEAVIYNLSYPYFEEVRIFKDGFPCPDEISDNFDDICAKQDNGQAVGYNVDAAADTLTHCNMVSIQKEVIQII